MYKIETSEHLDDKGIETHFRSYYTDASLLKMTKCRYSIKELLHKLDIVWRGNNGNTEINEV
jgi:hypothetical protein